tara:strand:+ start:1919 stop:2107 length:189 start_codon:yes stop_codon:yes gene_type:complete
VAETLDFLNASDGESWTQGWLMGDDISSENRAVMHRRNPFDGSLCWLLHRATLKGEKPRGRN